MARGNSSRPPLGISKLSANSPSEAAVSSPPPPRLVAPPVHVPPQWKMLILDLRPVWLFESGRLPPAIHIDLMGDWRAAIAALLGVYDPQQHERSFFLSDPRHSSSPSSLNLSGLRHLAGLRSSRAKHKTRDLESPPGLRSHGGGRSSVSSTCSPHGYTGSSSSGMLDSSNSQQLLGFVSGARSSTCGSESGGSGMGVGSPRPRLSRDKGGQGRNRGGISQCSLEQRDGRDRHEGRDESFSNTSSAAKEDSYRRRSSLQHRAAVATVAHGDEGCDGRQSQAERHEDNSPTRVSVIAAGGGERVREKATEDATPSVMLPHSRPSRSGGGGGGASRLLRGFRRRTQQILGPPSYLISSSSLSGPSREGSGEICSTYQEESLLCTPASEGDNLTLLGRKESAQSSRRGSLERRRGEDKGTGEQIQRVSQSFGRQRNSSLYTRRTYPSVRSSRTRRLTALPHYRGGSVSTPSLGTRWPCAVQSEISLVGDNSWKDQIDKLDEATEGERGSEEVSDFDDDYFSDDPALYRIDPSAQGASHFWAQPDSVSSTSLDSRTTVTALEAWRSLEKWSEKTQAQHHRGEARGADGEGRGRAADARHEEEEAGTGKKKRMWGFRSKASASREKRHGEKHADTKGTRKEREATSRSGGDLEKGTGLSLDVQRQKGSRRDWSSHTSSEAGETTRASLETRRRSKRIETHSSEVFVLAQGSSVPRPSGRHGTPEERRLHTRRKLAALRSNSHRHGLLHSDCKEKCRHAFSDLYGKIKEDDSSLRCSYSSSSFAAPCCVRYRRCFSDGDVPPLKYLRCFKSAAHSHSTSSRDLSISNNTRSLPSSPPTGRCNEDGRSLVVQVSACEARLDPGSSCASQVSASWIGVPVGGGPHENDCHPGARKSPLSADRGGAPHVKPHSLDPSRSSSPDVDGSRRDSSGKEERSGSESAYGSPAVSSHDSNALPKGISPKCSPLTQLLEEEARLAREQKGEAVNLAEESSSSTGTADEDEDQSGETESDSRKRARGSEADGEGHSHCRSSQFFLSSLMLGAGTASPRFFYSRGLSPDENAKAFKEEKVQIPSHHVCLITADENSYQDAMEVYRVLTQEMDVR